MTNTLTLDSTVPVIIFLYQCSAHIPFCFAVHSWIVIQEGERYTRYEVLWEKDTSTQSHLYTNAFAPFQGINRIPFYTKGFFSDPVLIGSLEWESARRWISIIKDSIHTYPYKSVYRLTGPNSNTYIQWILDQIEDFPYSLPWNAVGKTFLS